MIPVAPVPLGERPRGARRRVAALLLVMVLAGCSPTTSGAPEHPDKTKVPSVAGPVVPEPTPEPAVVRQPAAVPQPTVVPEPSASPEPAAAPAVEPAAPTTAGGLPPAFPVPPGCTVPANHAPCDPYPTPVAGPVERDGVACVAPAPAGASEAAVAYVAAVAAATPGWAAVDEHIVGHSPLVYDIDLVAQVQADALFLTGLGATPLQAEAAPVIDDLAGAVLAYDDALTSASRDMAHYGDHLDGIKVLSQARADASARVRDALGLPASSCAFHRP